MNRVKTHLLALSAYSRNADYLIKSMGYRASRIGRRDDVNKRRQRRAESKPLRAPRRKPRTSRGTLLVTVDLQQVRKQLEHCRAMVARYLTENPTGLGKEAERHARAAAHVWLQLHTAARFGSQSAQAAVQTLCAEYGLVSVLNLEQRRIEL